MVNRFIIDIRHQINNPWNKDSILLLADENFTFSLSILSSDKKDLKKEFINDPIKSKLDRKHNSRVIAAIHSFLIYRIIILNRTKINELKICRDANPKWVYDYLQKLFSYFNYLQILNNLKFSFINKDDDIIKSNIAHKKARTINKKGLKYDYTLTKEDIKNLKDFLKKKL